ncbi:putative ArsR family transcriptional regulator [Paenibacillus castaneae]|uniref:helix-turn-helix transcriptional regulator n=1 Tax=Paenibacillus castaneae TaxID=474957 RepID=UPI002444FBE4|nr:HTH domain-containing protein [Paenibacillus castaneae]NIK77267.1 putative ArsR family transcriptional regulator [Paenibacillus castaneae]
MKRSGTVRTGTVTAHLQGDSSTRERILMLLKTVGRMSASDLSSELDLTEMAIRRHMYVLEREGSVSIVSVRQAMGRPLHAYELTAEADELFPKNYHLLTLDLLDELADDPDTAELIDRMFEGRKKKLIERYAPRMVGKSLEEKVSELASIQNAGGYMVEVEAQSDGGFVLYEYNCPITQVAGKYQQACRCELSLFKALLEVPVERTECLAKGGGKCSYQIG